jgi:hypothetical protein
MKDGQYHGMDQYWHNDRRIDYVQQLKKDQENGLEIKFKYENAN